MLQVLRRGRQRELEVLRKLFSNNRTINIILVGILVPVGHLGLNSICLDQLDKIVVGNQAYVVF